MQRTKNYRYSFVGISVLALFFTLTSRRSESQEKPYYYYCRAFDNVNHIIYLTTALKQESPGDDVMYVADAGYAFAGYLHDKYGADFSGAGGPSCDSKKTDTEIYDEIDKDIREFNNSANRTVSVFSWRYKPKPKD